MPHRDLASADPFVPHPLFRAGHAQTIASNFLPRRSLLPVAEERLFQVEEDVQVRCLCNWRADRQSALTLVMVHGLEGSHQSQYMVGLGSKAWRAGMNVVRMNMRNCGDSERLTPTLYHSGLSADVGAVARTLIEQDRLPRIAFAGYSMGGTLVTNLAGEWGDAAPPQVVGFAAVSPALDLAASAEALHLPANRLYEYRFLWSLIRRVRRKARLFPDRYDSRRTRRLRSLWEFDDRITAHYCGFGNAANYYARCSPSRNLERIARPTLIIHALDDPFIRVLPATRAKLLANPHIRYLETHHGGHCGFLAAPNGYDGRWAEKQVVDFFKDGLKFPVSNFE